MVHIIKGAEPQALTQEKRNGVKLYSDLSTDTLDEIRAQMLVEQGCLCAYCMQRINLGEVTIEHFSAQHPTDVDYVAALTIDYRNMLGVCSGNECKGNPRKNLTCDKHRGNIPLVINPLHKHLVQQIKYDHTGKIYSDDPQINKDLNETLNLNYEGVLFKKNRKAVLDSLKRYMNKRFADKKVPVEKLRQWLYACYTGKNGMRDPFVGVAIYYLEKKIQRR